MNDFGKAEHDVVLSLARRYWRAFASDLPGHVQDEFRARVVARAFSRWQKLGGMTAEALERYASNDCPSTLAVLAREHKGEHRIVEKRGGRGRQRRVVKGTNRDVPLTAADEEPSRPGIGSSEDDEGGQFDQERGADFLEAADGGVRFWRRVRCLYAAKVVAALVGDGPGKRLGFHWVIDREEWARIVECVGWLPPDIDFARVVASMRTRTALVEVWSRPSFLRLAPLADGAERELTAIELTWVSLALGNRPRIDVLSHVDGKATTPRHAARVEHDTIAPIRSKVSAQQPIPLR